MTGSGPGARRRVSRRSVLAGGLGTLGALSLGGAGLAGCTPWRRATEKVGDVTGLADTEPTDRTFRSAARWGVDTTYRVLVPSGLDRPARPVLYLHGLGDDHGSTLDRDVADRVLLAARDAGVPLALVTVDGGRSYFHARSGGEDAGEMIRSELLPRLRDEAGLDTSALGLAGFSMGGYGALLLASRWDAAATGTRLGAVAVCDPALWLAPGDSAPGAFDDADDFAANDVFAPAALAALRALPVWVAVGGEDYFRTATEHLQSELGCPGGVHPGGHDAALRASVADEQFAFLSDHLR